MDRPAFRMALQRAVAAGFFLLLGVLPGYAGNDTRAADDSNCRSPAIDICELFPGPQGRIAKITSDNTAAVEVVVRRGDRCRPAAVGCFLNPGDKVFVRPPDKTVTVTIKLPNAKDAKVVDYMEIPEIQGHGFLDRPALALLLDLAGANLSKAQEIALAAIGATRSPDPTAEITLPGAVGTAPQAVDRGRPLLLRWYGGAPPFRIEWASAGGTRHQVIETCERNQRFDLSSDPRGDDYTLTIAGSNDVRLTLPLRLVVATNVPVAPGIEVAQDEETRELVEAVWLLTRAPITWRLEALSRLEFLARDHDNIVAQAIVDPAPSPDGQKDR
jgi:hypothetical protein